MKLDMYINGVFIALWMNACPGDIGGHLGKVTKYPVPSSHESL